MKHIVNLILSQPDHDFISMRSRRHQKTYMLEANNADEAILRASRKFKQLGFYVHEAKIVEQQVEKLDEAREAPMYNVTDRSGRVVGTHQHGRGFMSSRPDEYKSHPVTIPDGTKIDRSEDLEAARANREAKQKDVQRKVDKGDVSQRAGKAQAGSALADYLKKKAERMEESTQVDSSKYLEEKLTAADDASKWIHDFVHSDNPKFEGKSKKERIQMALGAKYAADRAVKEEVEQVEEAFTYQQKLASINVLPHHIDMGPGRHFGSGKDLSNDDNYNDALKSAKEWAKKKYPGEHKIIHTDQRGATIKTGSVDNVRREMKNVKEEVQIDESHGYYRYTGSVTHPDDVDHEKAKTWELTIPEDKTIGEYPSDKLEKKIRAENSHLTHHEVKAVAATDGENGPDGNGEIVDVTHKGKKQSHRVYCDTEPDYVYEQVELDEAKKKSAANFDVGDQVNVNWPGYAAHGHSGVVKYNNGDGSYLVHLHPGKGASGLQTKMQVSGLFGKGEMELGGKGVQMGGTHTVVPGHTLTKLNEEVEQIDELSKNALADYIRNAAPTVDRKNAVAQGMDILARKTTVPRKKQMFQTSAQTWRNAAKRRVAGIKLAADKLAREEVEQIDEISAQAGQNKTLSNVMAASTGATKNRDVGLTPEITGHPTTQAMNKYIGRAVRRGEFPEESEYHASFEPSQSGGYHPRVVTNSGSTEYVAKGHYSTPKAAEEGARAYLNAYKKYGPDYAQKVGAHHAKIHPDAIKEEVELDEGLKDVVKNVAKKTVVGAVLAAGALGSHAAHADAASGTPGFGAGVKPVVLQKAPAIQKASIELKAPNSNNPNAKLSGSEHSASSASASSASAKPAEVDKWHSLHPDPEIRAKINAKYQEVKAKGGSGIDAYRAAHSADIYESELDEARAMDYKMSRSGVAGDRGNSKGGDITVSQSQKDELAKIFAKDDKKQDKKMEEGYYKDIATKKAEDKRLAAAQKALDAAKKTRKTVVGGVAHKINTSPTSNDSGNRW